MKSLNPDYQKQIDALVEELQQLEAFQSYLEEEEEEDYQTIRETIEPKISAIYEDVASNNPLQLLAFEKALIKAELEGLYLPRILGYSVLRGVINKQYKYIRPQSHFREILLAICNSSNFDLIKKRIGQTIQMGFALSSDIWITNLINEISNKRIRYFLLGQKLPRYRDLKERRIGYLRYQNQFKQEEFMTATFPNTRSELKVLYPSVLKFMKHRIATGKDNSNILDAIKAFLDNEAFKGTDELIEMLALYANFFDLAKKDQEHLSGILNDYRKNIKDFDDKWLENILNIHNSPLHLDSTADKRVAALLDSSVKDKLTDYYQLTNTIHSKGYLHEDTIEQTRIYYNAHEGLSTENECLRKTIFNYFARFLNNIETEDYQEYFELSKIFPVYIKIFSNQHFVQNLKELCMAYVKKLLKKYTDKRGKDYQDIKRFVSANFLDLGFLKQKEIVELFKTRRKKKKVS